jgi:hypothetical protein
VVEWGGLENRCGGDSTQGSNPCPSAISSDSLLHSIHKTIVAKAGYSICLKINYQIPPHPPFSKGGMGGLLNFHKILCEPKTYDRFPKKIFPSRHHVTVDKRIGN